MSPLIAQTLCLSLSEAATASGVPRATLLNWIKSGKLPASKDFPSNGHATGEWWWIVDADLEQYLGRRLYPGRGELDSELRGVEGALQKAIEAMGDNEGEAVTQVKFALQVVGDLRGRLEGAPLPPGGKPSMVFGIDDDELPWATKE